MLCLSLSDNRKKDKMTMSNMRSSLLAPCLKFFFCLPLFFFCLVQFQPQVADASPPPRGFADLVEKHGPNVVNIYSTQVVKSQQLPYNYYFDQGDLPELFKHFFDIPQQQKALPEQKRSSLGSGVIISADGYIVTNNHVVEDADTINVKLANYEEHQAVIIGRDPKTDLALIKIDPGHPLVFAKFGNSDDLRVGDWVIAIGNPFGFEQTVTAGIVSGKGRSLGDGPYQNFIQTDASINPGNSGGPLFNMQGEMMGINTAIYSKTGGNIGLGFAIPANMAKSVIDQLKGTGKVTRGMLGVMIQPVTHELAEQFGLTRPIGALVGQVVEGGPADNAGIGPGDIILRYRGKEISQMSMLPALVAQTPVGERVPVTIFQNNREKEVRVVITELPEKGNGKRSRPREENFTTEMGLSLRPMDQETARSLKLREDRGLIITGVEPGSNAGVAGLRKNDIILEAGLSAKSKPMNTLDDFRDLVHKAIKKKKNILLRVRSGQQLRFVLLKVG